MLPQQEISEKTKVDYLKSLVGKIYKLLPLYENGKWEGMNIYLWGLLNIICSSNELYFDGKLSDVHVKLHSIYSNDLGHDGVRKIVLECTNDVGRLVDNMGEQHERNNQRCE